MTLPPSVDNPPRLVRDINLTTAGSDPSQFTAVGDVGYFAATDISSGRELWRSDGTAAGTTLVSDIAAGVASSSPAALTNVSGTLSFTADDGSHGTELWKSDGSTIGTMLVKDIALDTAGSNPTNLDGRQRNVVLCSQRWQPWH